MMSDGSVTVLSHMCGDDVFSGHFGATFPMCGVAVCMGEVAVRGAW